MPGAQQRAAAANNYLKAVQVNGAYGKGNRPSTPVKGIISGEYGNIAAEEINMKYDYAA